MKLLIGTDLKMRASTLGIVILILLEMVIKVLESMVGITMK
jgi:hypothetical protein